MNTNPRLLKCLLSLSLSSALATSTRATQVVDFDGTDNNLITSGNINWGTSASSTLIQSAGNPDIVLSTLEYGTTLATNGVGTYTGPTMKGGFYINALYEEGTATIGSSNQYWGQIINNLGTPAQDYIQIRRNNNAGTAGTINNGSTTRAVFTFDTGGSFGLNGSSAFSLTGSISATTSEVAHWVVVSEGTTYVSQTPIDFTSTSTTTVYTFDDPDTTNWAAWTPNSDLSNLPDFTTTVAGTTLTSITETGFFFEKTGTTNLNSTFRVFTADLADPNAGGYSSWADINAPTGTPGDDYDDDGVSNGVEYVAGGTAATNDLGKMPSISAIGGNMVFTFVRDQASIDGSTTVAIEVGTTLESWPDSYAVPDDAVATDPGVTVVKDSPTTGFDTVTLSVTRTPDAMKFARLKVTP